jgi:ribonuclease Z
MAMLYLLGTGAALSDGARTTTMLAFVATESVLVVDCGGDVVQRLLAEHIDLNHLEALIITHEHPDHVGGFPLFMERIWLAGRRRPIDVYGPAPALSQARRIWEAFNTGGWQGVPEIHWHEVPLAEGAPVLENEVWKVSAAPGTHSVPVIGIRVEDRAGGGAVAYSSDTERSDAIARLADGADILVHEATKESFRGHTTYEDAAHVARQAGVGRLVLVHLPPNARAADLADARKSFSPIQLGADGDCWNF